MKILKIFGVVVGIHLFALMLIFANPGCSSTSKPAPAPIDTVAKSEPAPGITVPGATAAVTVPTGDASPVSAAPINFNPDAPALTAPGSGGGIRFMPTRPNTAAASTLVAEPVTDVTPATTYVVKSGDSLWSIASKNHLTASELASANNIKVSAVLQPGHKLLIPSKPVASAAGATAMTATAKPAAETAAPKSPPADAVKHTVKSGETLSIIAKTYGVKQGDIAVANNITDPAKIRAGMVLVIPGWKTPVGKGAASAAKSSAPAAPSTTAKPAAEPPKPLFNPAATGSDADSPVKAAPPASTSDVPVIKVDEAPAPKKP